MRAERIRLSQGAPSRSEPGVSTRETSNASKKRKASDDDEDTRKRTKPIVVPYSSLPDKGVEAENTTSRTPSPIEYSRPTSDSIEPNGLGTQNTEQSIDEAEWAAFERDVATPPPALSSVPSALMAQATISAAPVSAASLAAQEKAEERASGRERREAEVEAEKDDAARLLEEEFDEMESLEERVRRLREKREELRIMRDRAKDPATEAEEEDRAGRFQEMTDTGSVDQGQSDDEGFDDWTFGR